MKAHTMIVCICNNVSDRDIRRAVAGGMRTMTQLRRNLGVATCCGKCDPCARQVLREALAAEEQQTAAATLPTAWMPA
jgi:bacterioferritin-associated ferredoxin